MNFLKKHALKFFIIVILGLISFSIYKSKKIDNVKQETIKKTTIKRGTVNKTITISGEIKTDEKVELRFQTSGRLSWVGVKEGDYVKKYQTIATLDQRQLQNDLQKYLNSYEKTRYDFEQIKDDNKDNVVALSQQIREKAERILKKNQLDLDSSVINVEIASLAKEYSNLWTPIEGIVTKINTPIAGTNITPAGAEFQIINPNTLYFSAQAEQTEIIDIQNGMKGELTLDAYPDNAVQGTISYIAFTPTSGESGTVYEIKIDFPKDDNKVIKLGMTGDAVFTLKEKYSVLYAPSAYIKNEGKKRYIYIMENDKKTKVYIKTGLEGDNRTEILDGVTENTLIYD